MTYLSSIAKESVVYKLNSKCTAIGRSQAHAPIVRVQKVAEIIIGAVHVEP